MGYLTPGTSPSFLTFKVWCSLATSLLLSPLQAWEGAVGCSLPLFPRRRKVSGGTGNGRGGYDFQACPHPKPPNSLPRVAASHS